MNIFMRLPAKQSWLGYAVAILGVAFVTILFGLLLPGVSPVAIAPCFFLVVLIASSIGGLGPGITASIAGMLCFDYFFLPPIWKIFTRDSWVEILVFLITAVLTSQLSSFARSRANDAEKRREEVWRLYRLSRAIIATPDFETAVSSISRQVVEV